jgi:hypothetical protein
LTQDFQAVIRSYAVEPGGKGGLTSESTQPSPDREEDILGNLCRVGLIAQHVEAHAKNSTLVTADELFVGVDVSVRGTKDENCVRCLSHFGYSPSALDHSECIPEQRD